MSDRAYKTPLVDMLRNVPQNHRTEWAIQWAEDGAETGHAMCAIGRLAHEAADRIVELEATQAQAMQGDAVGEVYFSAHDAAEVFWFVHPQEGAKLYTAPQPVNQQLLEALVAVRSCMAIGIPEFSLHDREVMMQADDAIDAAIAAAQEGK